MSEKILISFPAGGSGNLIAGLIYCLQTNLNLHPIESNGSMHVDGSWKKISTINLIDIWANPCCIFITHDNLNVAVKKLKVIQVRYQDTSIDTIKKLSIGKNLQGTIKWLKETNQYKSVEDAVNSIAGSLSRVRTTFEGHHDFLNFEDIWADPDKLLTDLSNIVGLPVNNRAKKLLYDYRQINSMLYNINLSEWPDIS